MAEGELKDYREKRDFRKTGEPAGRNAEGEARFVIQKHDASTLHYDFRLAVEGVLKSWVLPKGPSTDPREKRLAIPTDDHPLGYAEFEGVIPEDEYGGGTVLVWDAGPYQNLKEEQRSMTEALEEGQVEVWLEGEKLHGGYALIRTGDEEPRWLMVKMNDKGADARRNPVSTEPKSVLSGRAMEEVSEQERPQ